MVSSRNIEKLGMSSKIRKFKENDFEKFREVKKLNKPNRKKLRNKDLE